VQFLSWFCFKIEYAPGKGNKADGLSHQLDYTGSLEEDQKGVLLSPDQFINVAVVLSMPKFLEHLWHSDLPCLKDGWYMQDGLLCDAGGRIVMPSNVSLHTEII
jgi:hypothetical protein